MSENTNNNDQLQNKEQNPTGTEYNSQQANKRTKVQIEIVKWSRLFDALGDNKKIAKLIAITTLLLTIVFIGIAGLSLILKRFYPYNVINANPYGAAIIEQEDKELIYWLFNTADLWANSGIKVKAGDVITVRASGAMHTAIHNVVDASQNNTVLPNEYTSPIGGLSSTREKDKVRAELRIAPDVTWGELLMQVIPEDHAKGGNSHKWYYDLQHPKNKKDETTNTDFLDGRGKTADIYVVGTERDEIRIRTSGILHFAVNDIVLTDRVINIINNAPSKYMIGKTEVDTTRDLGKIENTAAKSFIRANQGIRIDETKYYQKTGFVDAWYVDNIGSVLVIIERKKNK